MSQTLVFLAKTVLLGGVIIWFGDTEALPALVRIAALVVGLSSCSSAAAWLWIVSFAIAG